MISSEFMSALTSASSLVIECEFCGRTYFTDKECDGDYAPGRYEELKELQNKEPDKYIETTEYTHWGIIDGKQAVVDCQCNSLEKYEKWIWDHRQIIVQYIIDRADMFYLYAKDQKEEIEPLRKIISHDKKEA